MIVIENRIVSFAFVFQVQGLAVRPEFGRHREEKKNEHDEDRNGRSLLLFEAPITLLRILV
jgi:hypothetical protein